jgi:hypothetical protein
MWFSGTSSAGHLWDNLGAIQKGPLGGDVLEKLETLFGRVDCVNGQ